MRKAAKKKVPLRKRAPKATLPDPAGEPALSPDRFTHRLIQAVLIEIRATRQYVEWIHQMLANQEIGRDVLGELPDPKVLKENLKQKKHGERQALQQILTARANSGIGDGGNELTAEEKQRIAAGEDITTVLGL